MALEPGSAPATTAPRWIRAPFTLSVLGGGQNLTHLSYSPADSKSAVASRSASRATHLARPCGPRRRATQPSRRRPSCCVTAAVNRMATAANNSRSSPVSGRPILSHRVGEAEPPRVAQMEPGRVTHMEPPRGGHVEPPSGT